MANRIRLRYAGRFVAAGLEVLRDAQGAFHADRASRLSAGLAYYSVFALVPTIFLALAIAGTIVGQEATEGRLVDGLDDVLGMAAAEQIEEGVAGLRGCGTTSTARASYCSALVGWCTPHRRCSLPGGTLSR